MKLSTKSTYGLRALAFLAASYPKQVSITELAEQEKISAKYLEAIFASLKKGKIVTSVKGAQGGYQLSAKPEAISLWQAMDCLEKQMPAGYCIRGGGKNYCQPSCCGVGSVLAEIQELIAKKLKAKSLKDLVRK